LEYHAVPDIIRDVLAVWVGVFRFENQVLEYLREEQTGKAAPQLSRKQAISRRNSDMKTRSWGTEVKF
jgi:hypothetical protein